MSYHQVPSPTYHQYEAYSTVSPTTIPDAQRIHTPKRRRVGSVTLPEFDPAAQPFIPHDDMFDFSFPPTLDLSQHSPPPIPPNGGIFSSAWDMDFRYDDLQTFGPPPDQNENQHRPSQPLCTRPHFTNYLHYGEPPRMYREPPDYHGWQMSRITGGPPTFPQYIRPPIPNPTPNELQRRYEAPSHALQLMSAPHALNLSPLQRAPVPVQPPQPVPLPATSIRRKGAITLSLSRASEASILDLPEHKRECPACQLEFEPDNYLAVISCCGTAMHATCFSAWVNSQTYSKTKVCMKCRKAIDARRALNNVVPPVTDKSWDAGVDFDAPPHVMRDSKTEIDISGRNDAMYRRIAHMRRDPSYRRRVAMLSENDIPAEFRSAYQEIQREHEKESEDLKARYRNARSEWRTAFEAEARAAQTVVAAKDAQQAGSGMTQREVEGLVERHRETKEIQERRHNAYRAVQTEFDRMQQRHEARDRAFTQQIMRR